MNIKLKALITGLGIIILILVSGRIEEPEKSNAEGQPIITIHCKDNTTETLTPEHERYNKILNISMKILNSIDKNKAVYLIVPKEIEDGTISENYVELIFSNPVNISDELGNGESKVIILLSGEYKDLVFINNKEYWGTKSPKISTSELSLIECIKK